MKIVEKYIRRFNSLNGELVRKETVRAFYNEVKACGKPELKELETKLSNALAKMNGVPVYLDFKPIALPKVTQPKVIAVQKNKVAKPFVPIRENKIALPPVQRLERVKDTKKVSKKIVEKKKVVVQKPATSSTRPKGIYGVNDIANRNIKQIDLDGRYKDDFNELYTDTQMMFWGPPGGGKTSYLLYFAQYLATKKSLKVLYVANEEIQRSTFTKKMKELKIEDHRNLDFAEELPDDVSGYDAIFLDSVQTLGFDLETYVEWAKTNRGKLLIPVIQSTKDGDFKGGKDWEHEMDFAGQIRNRKLIVRKNRNDPDFYQKSEKLITDDLIESKKKSHKIRQTVLEQMQPKKEEPLGQISII